MLDLPKEWETLLQREILGERILKKYDNESTHKILHHLSWGDERASVQIIFDIIQTIKEYISYFYLET